MNINQEDDDVLNIEIDQQQQHQQHQQQQQHNSHGFIILNGLDNLKSNKILCDVTLIAENRQFDAHKVVLASCSDYFRSMFTSGMKESNQNLIELKGITSKGLEKVIEVIYRSETKLEGDDIFDLIAAATHLQVIPVINYCERNFLCGMNSTNFNDFIQTAKLYQMDLALKQIDLFIINNLSRIATDGYLKQLSSEQLIKCISSRELRMKEIDIFNIVWQWLYETQTHFKYDLIRELMKQIRFTLISPIDIVNKVQILNSQMMNDDFCRQLVLLALNYHVVPYSQSVQKLLNNDLRSPITTIVTIGGREINPNPCLHDTCFVTEFRSTCNSNIPIARRELTQLPSVLSHMQICVLNNYIYVIGGCVSQCAHAESAVNTVHRYDPRFNTWIQVASMNDKRSYFYACTLNYNDKMYIFAVGGKNRDGAIATVECYDANTNTWSYVQSMPAVYHAHSGCVFNNQIYISGGYSQGQFTSDLQLYNPVTDQWEDLCSMNSARGWHCMCEADGKLFVFGGCHLNANQQAQPVMQTEYYSPNYDQWTILAPISNLHKEASCIKYANHIYILGGYNIQAKCGQKMVSRYDYVNDIWDNIGQLPVGQTGVGYCVCDLPWYIFQDNKESISTAAAATSSTTIGTNNNNNKTGTTTTTIATTNATTTTTNESITTQQQQTPTLSSPTTSSNTIQQQQQQ